MVKGVSLDFGRHRFTGDATVFSESHAPIASHPSDKELPWIYLRGRVPIAL